MFLKYIITENDMSAFTEVIADLLNQDIVEENSWDIGNNMKAFKMCKVEQCKTKISDLLKVTGWIHMGKVLQPYVYDSNVFQLSDVIKESHDEKGFIIVINDGGRIMHMDASYADVLVCKGDVMDIDTLRDEYVMYGHSGNIMYVDELPDKSVLLMSYGVTMDFAEYHYYDEDDDYDDGPISCTLIYNYHGTDKVYRAPGPIYFPEYKNLVPLKDHGLTIFDECPYCGEKIKLSSDNNTEICKNVFCSGKTLFQYIIAGHLYNDSLTKKGLNELIHKGYNTPEKMYALNKADLRKLINDSDTLVRVYDFIYTVLGNIVKPKVADDLITLCRLRNENYKPLESLSIYIESSNLSLSTELTQLGACIVEKVDSPQDTLVLSSNPETLAELLRSMEEKNNPKYLELKAVNISDCKTVVEVVEKILHGEHITVGAYK